MNARTPDHDRPRRAGIIDSHARASVEPRISALRFRRRACSAAMVSLVGWTALEASVQAAKTLQVREHALSPAVLRERAGVLKPSAVKGRIVLDPSKISATTHDASATHVATDLEGNAVAVSKLPDGTIALDQPPDRGIIVKRQTAIPMAMRKGAQWLPSVYVAPTAQPGASVRDTLSTYITFSNAPIAWDTSNDMYRIRADVGIVKNNDSAIGGAIGTKALVKLSFHGVTLKDDPPELTIERLAVEGEQGFELGFTRTDASDPRLIVHSTLAADQAYLMDVEPRLDLTPDHNPVLGLGFEDTTVSVEIVQAHGAPLRLGERVVAEIQCEGVRKKSGDEIKLDDNAPRASFAVTSGLIGDAHIIATARTSTKEIVGSVTIRQQMPWAQLAVALFGGALGGFARKFRKGARRIDTRKRVLEGLIVGLVAFVAGALGVGFLNLPREIVSTVAGALLTGALTGFAGVTVIETIAQRSQPTAS
jgi:hypothetical protein